MARAISALSSTWSDVLGYFDIINYDDAKSSDGVSQWPGKKPKRGWAHI